MQIATVQRASISSYPYTTEPPDAKDSLCLPATSSIRPSVRHDESLQKRQRKTNCLRINRIPPYV